MKKIINGKMYDTEKGKTIGYQRSDDDIHYLCESMHQKSTGEFFIHHYESYDYIKPISEQDAKEWALNKLKAEAYTATFGEVEE